MRSDAEQREWGADEAHIGSGDPGAAHLRAGVAAERCRGRARADSFARATGHGLRGARRPAPDHGPLHVHPVLDRLCADGAIEEPGPRPRLVARPHDRRDDPSPHRGERGSSESRHAGLDARAPRGRHHAAGRPGAWGLHRRPPVEAHADRLHERPRIDDLGRSAPQAVRVLRGRRWVHPRAEGVLRRPRRRRHRCRSAGRRRGGTRTDPDPGTGHAEDPVGPGRCRAVDHRGERVRPDGPRRVRRRAAPERLPSLHDPSRVALGRIPPPPGRVRHRVRRPRRHDLDGVVLRGPSGGSGPRRPGDDRDRRREPGGGAVPRLPGEHERFPHRREPCRPARRPRSRAWSERERSS